MDIYIADLNHRLAMAYALNTDFRNAVLYETRNKNILAQVVYADSSDADGDGDANSSSTTTKSTTSKEETQQHVSIRNAKFYINLYAKFAVQVANGNFKNFQLPQQMSKLNPSRWMSFSHQIRMKSLFSMEDILKQMKYQLKIKQQNQSTKEQGSQESVQGEQQQQQQVAV